MHFLRNYQLLRIYFSNNVDLLGRRYRVSRSLEPCPTSSFHFQSSGYLGRQRDGSRVVSWNVHFGSSPGSWWLFSSLKEAPQLLIWNFSSSVVVSRQLLIDFDQSSWLRQGHFAAAFAWFRCVQQVPNVQGVWMPFKAVAGSSCCIRYHKSFKRSKIACTFGFYNLSGFKSSLQVRIMHYIRF